MPRAKSTSTHTTRTCIESITTEVTVTKSFQPLGFDEGPCRCAKCVRKAGPMRESFESVCAAVSKALSAAYERSDDPTFRAYNAEHCKTVATDFINGIDDSDIDSLTTLFTCLPDDECRRLVASELLILAAQDGQPDLIELLHCSYDADLSTMDLHNLGTPLMHAVNNNHLSAVKMLIDLDAYLDEKSDKGYTALMVAAFSDRGMMAEALIQAGAEVDAVDNKNRTALLLAAMYGSTEVIKVLSAAGADVSHEDMDGCTAAQLAKENTRSSASEVLKKWEMRHRMQERRKTRAQKDKGCSDELSAEERAKREAKSQEAMNKLLKELESEGTKKGKGKKKGAGHRASTSTCTADEHEDFSAPTTPPQPSTPVKSTEGGCSGGGEGGAGTHWPHFGAAQWERGEPSSGLVPAVAAAAAEAAAAAAAAVVPPPAPAPAPLMAPETPKKESYDTPESLRQQWDSALDEAAKCMDEQRQPVLLEKVQRLLPLVAAAGISVKYGRKVLQRLEAVGPAREQLRAAISAPQPSGAEVSDAVRSAKSVRCLLDPALVAEADALMQRLSVQEEQERWTQLADKMKLGNSQSAPPPAAPMLTPQQAQPKQEAYMYDEVDAEVECVVCLSEIKSVCCVPCGHMCMCEGCASEVQRSSGCCPVCRTDIECVIEILA